jgi:putative transposase
MQYQHEGHNVDLVVYHSMWCIMWCPKRRRKVLGGPVRDRLEHIIHEVVAENGWEWLGVAGSGWEIIRLGILPDHVQLCIGSNPTTLPSDIQGRSKGRSKGRSSQDLRQEFPHLRKLPSLWTRSF